MAKDAASEADTYFKTWAMREVSDIVNAAASEADTSLRMVRLYDSAITKLAASEAEASFVIERLYDSAMVKLAVSDACFVTDGTPDPLIGAALIG